MSVEHMSSRLRAVVEGRDLDPYPLTRRDIASISGLPKRTVSRLVRGSTSPLFDTVVRIALATGISLDDLAGLDKCPECGRIKRAEEVHCGNEAAA